MRYAVAIGYPLRLYVERDRAVQEIGASVRLTALRPPHF